MESLRRSVKHLIRSTENLKRTIVLNRPLKVSNRPFPVRNKSIKALNESFETQIRSIKPAKSGRYSRSSLLSRPITEFTFIGDSYRAFETIAIGISRCVTDADRFS